MNRRTVLATAGAITLVIVTGTAAVAANLGLLGSATDSGDIGTLTPAAATAEPQQPQTVIVEQAPASTTGSTTAAPSAASTYDDEEDDHAYDHDDEEYDHGGRADESHAEYEHYEGSDDDD
jgi:hypothetical protein